MGNLRPGGKPLLGKDEIILGAPAWSLWELEQRWRNWKNENDSYRKQSGRRSGLITRTVGLLWLLVALLFVRWEGTGSLTGTLYSTL